MKPTLVQYDAPGWGVGEIWLDEDGLVFHCELPRPRRPGRAQRGSPAARALQSRVRRFFAGKADDFLDVPLAVPDGFYGECVRVLRGIPRGEVVTYGELASLAGFPGAARAAGTFCGRCALSPFVPTHRVVGSNGIGSYGDLGVDYKRRLLALEGVSL
jgi:methylated-DNA-[protein]-cysteine S-methyltransferase